MVHVFVLFMRIDGCAYVDDKVFKIMFMPQQHVIKNDIV